VKRDPLDSLREDLLVSPDLTDAVMARLGYRPATRRVARLRRALHVGTCLAVIGASIVGVAWAIDLGWKSRLANDTDSRRAANLASPDPDRRWDALEESLLPLRRIVEEIEPASAPSGFAGSTPPLWLSARAPLGET